MIIKTKINKIKEQKTLACAEISKYKNTDTVLIYFYFKRLPE